MKSKQINNIDINTELNKIYYDIKTGFSSLDKLYTQAKLAGLNITKKEVKNYRDNQGLNQVLKPIRKQKEYSSHYAFQPRHIYEMDIIVYDRYTYHKYSYMLVVIDVYSRFAQVRPMTNRRIETIIKNYQSILTVMKAPQILQSDNEFNKKLFIEELDKSSTKTYFTDPDEIHKNPIVERFNKTVSQNIQKVRISLKRYDWYEYVYDVVDNYNTTKHSTVKGKPLEIFKELDMNKQVYKYVENPFIVGDKVRIARKKKIFDKADVLTYSVKIYIVEAIKKNKIKLHDIKKYYKPYELNKIESTNEIDNINNIEVPQTQTKNNKLKQLHKREDILNNNILTTKRTRKPNPKYN